MLRIDGLVVRFDGLRALDGLSLAVPAGARVGVLGPNGSGKTTLFNAISGLTGLAGGTIRLDGRATSGLAPHRIAAAGVARTFQTVRLFQRLSALDNVLPRVGPGATTSSDARRTALAASTASVSAKARHHGRRSRRVRATAARNRPRDGTAAAAAARRRADRRPVASRSRQHHRPPRSLHRSGDDDPADRTQRRGH